MMKKITFFAFFAFFFLSSLSTFGAIVSWDGGAGTTNWGDAANWSANAIPTASDDVLLDGISIQNVVVSTIKSLTVSGYVTLSHVAGVAAGALTIASGGSISIPSGSTLELGGTNATVALKIAFASGATTSTILGTLKLTGAGTQYNGGNVVTYVGDTSTSSPEGAIYVNGGSVSNTTTVGLKFRASGVLYMYASGIPTASYDPASTIKIYDSGVSFPTPTTSFTTTISSVGNLEFYSAWSSSANPIVRMTGLPTTNPTATSNNKWIINGNLKIDAGTAATVALGSSAAVSTQVNATVNGNVDVVSGNFEIARSSATTVGSLTINGTLNVASGSTFYVKGASSTGTTNCYIKGHITNDGTISESGAAAAISTFECNGTASQNIGGNFAGNLTLKINNPNNVALNANLSMNGTGSLHLVNLASGKVIMGGFDAKIPASITGASSSNYFVTSGTGSLILKSIAAGTTATFPIGPDASTYCPASMIAQTGHVTDDLKARVSTVTTGPPHADPTKVFPYEWELGEGVAGGSKVQVAFQSSTAPANFSASGSGAIGHLENNYWIEYPAGITQPSGAFLLTSNGNVITSFSPFAMGQLGAVLPIELTYFRAEPKAKQVQLTWQTALERNATEFIVERSQDAIHFQAIGTVDAAGNSSSAKDYTFTDISAKNGLNYYRLRQVDTDGILFLTSIISIDLLKKGTILETAFLDENKNLNLVVQNVNADQRATVLVSDLSGALIEKKALDFSEGNNQYQLSLSSLASGNYIITIVMDSQVLAKQIFVK